MNTITLTSGMEDFGSGASEEEAIADACENAAYPDGDGGWLPVTREWIEEQQCAFVRNKVIGLGLYFRED